MSRSRGPRPHSGHRSHRRRGSGRSQHQPAGPVRFGKVSADELLDELLDDIELRLAEARNLFPSAGYAARMYSCDHCGTLHGCVAPAADLVDGYPCPCCHRPQAAVTNVGVPRAP